MSMVFYSKVNILILMSVPYHNLLMIQRDFFMIYHRSQVLTVGGRSLAAY